MAPFTGKGGFFTVKGGFFTVKGGFFTVKGGFFTGQSSNLYPSISPSVFGVRPRRLAQRLLFRCEEKEKTIIRTIMIGQNPTSSVLGVMRWYLVLPNATTITKPLRNRKSIFRTFLIGENQLYQFLELGDGVWCS